MKLVDNAAVNGSIEVFQPKPIKKFDPNFNVESEFYEGGAEFAIKLVNFSPPESRSSTTIKMTSRGRG